MDKKGYYATKGIQYILAIVFLLSGIGKLIESHNAQIVLDQLMGKSGYIFIIVVGISIIELIISILLFLEIKTKFTLGIALLLLICFTSGLGYLYFQNISINDCGCFGVFGSGMSLEVSLLKNFVLIALIIMTYLLYEYETRETKASAMK